MSVIEIVGIDPGEHTGLAFLRVEDGRRGFVSEQCFRHRAVKRLDRHALLIHQRRERLDVVCERFDITRDTAKTARDSNIAIRTLGACEYIAATYDAEFVEYGRADAKSFVPDELLRALGFYNPGRGHANDAARQVVFHLNRRYNPILSDMVKASNYLGD